MTQEIITEWPWLWHPDIHWYHQYVNLSSVGPEIWDALHLAMLTSHSIYNESHVAFKWVAYVVPNITALNVLYKEQYEGTGRNMFGCWPVIYGRHPDWVTWELIWRCGNYNPAQIAQYNDLKEWDHAYNDAKPMVDICIGIGTVVTTIGVPGKLVLL